MNWIESLFHISPDGGSGSLELLFIICPIAGLVIGAVGFFWFRNRRQ